MQRTNSDVSSLVLPPPCFRKKASWSAGSARCSRALSVQSSSDSFMSSSWSRAAGNTPFSVAGASAGSIRSSPPVMVSSSPLSKEIKFPSTQGKLDIVRETRGRSQGSLFSLGGSFDSSITSTMRQPAAGLGYGCSRFLARLPPHPESLEFVQEEENATSSNNEGSDWPQMEPFREDSWWKEDQMKDRWKQELKQMEEKMKELLREETPPPPSPKSKDLTVTSDRKRQRTREKWKLRIGNQSKREKAREPIPGAKEGKVQLLQQMYDRLHSYNIAGSLESSGIPLEITQFNTFNDLPCSPNESAIGNVNSSSQKKTTTPEHASTRKKSWKHSSSTDPTTCSIQSPLLDIDQTVENDDIASHFSKRQRGDRVRSMQMALFRPKSFTTESQGPQQRQYTDSSIKIRESPPPSPFAYWQQDAQSTASTPVWGNQLSHQEQRRQADEEDDDEDNNHLIPLAKQSSMRQVADAVVEGIIDWAASFDSTKLKNGPLDDSQQEDTVPVALEPNWHAAFDSGKDRKPGTRSSLDPIIHIPPGGDERDDYIENGGAFARTIKHEEFDTRAGKRVSPFQRFRSRSPTTTCSGPQKEASRAISPNREVICGSSASDADERRGQRSSSPVLNLKTILKPITSNKASSRTGYVEKMSNGENDSVERPLTSVCACPMSFDVQADDDINESALEETLVSFGKDPSPLKRVPKKVRFMRHTTEKVIPYDGVEAESVASIGEIVESLMVMTGCPADPEAEYDEYSIISSDEDSTDGQGSSIRTDGSLNDSLTSENGITTIQRSQSPVELIGEALRAIVETPSKQEGTGAGLEAPIESKKPSSPTTRILPSRGLMRKVLGRNLAKRPARAISDPVIVQRGNTVELMVNETLANLRDIWSQKKEKTSDGSPQVDAATQPSQNIDHRENWFGDGPVVKKETSRMDEGLHTVTLFSLGRASPTSPILAENDLTSILPQPHVQQNKKHQPERQRSAVRFVKQILHRKNSQNDPAILRRDDSKEVEAREEKGAMDLIGGDSSDRRSLSVASTSSALATKAEHSGPPPQGERGGVNKSATRKRRQKCNPENDDVHNKPQQKDDSGLPACQCMCYRLGNTPSNRVPDQVVCDNNYLSHEELLAKKGRYSSDITEDHFDDYKRQQIGDGLHGTSNVVPRVSGRGSYRKAAHQPHQTDDDASHSDDSVNQMVVEWLVDSLTFIGKGGDPGNLTLKKSTSFLDQVLKTMGIKGKAETPMFNLFQCPAPPVSSSTEDWATTFSFCKVDSHSSREWHEIVATQEYENENVPMTRWTAEPKTHSPLGNGVRHGDGIGDSPSGYSKVRSKRNKVRRQKLRHNRDASNHQPRRASPEVIPCRGLRNAEICKMQRE